MACGGVAVEVYTAGGLEDAVQLDHALRHHREIRHHVVLAEEGAQGLRAAHRLCQPVQ